jgi:hypothetical protein
MHRLNMTRSLITAPVVSKLLSIDKHNIDMTVVPDNCDESVEQMTTCVSLEVTYIYIYIYILSVTCLRKVIVSVLN